MIRLKIDLLKITGARTFTAKDGTACIAFPLEANNVYITPKGAHNLTLTLMDNKQGRDQYDQDGFCTVDVGKDRRLAGERGPILGNWKDLDLGGSGNQRQGRDVPASEAVRKSAPAQATQPDDEEDETIPF
jgi:hypothetical protein